QMDRPVKVIAVVSSEAAEGRSTVAINLALAFAEADRQTLLIDADLRRPRIAEYLGIEGAVGLSDVLARQVDLDTALQTWGEQKLHVLASGSLPPHPSELLGSRQMADLVARLRSEFDTTIIDTPPLRRPGRSAYGAYVATRPSDAAADEHGPRTTRGQPRHRRRGNQPGERQC